MSYTSVFKEQGMNPVLSVLKDEIKALYLEDDTPWIIGYSGGKDSTAVLQITWLAVSELKPEERTKPVHVISTDTLVENPVVSLWVEHSQEVMRKSAKKAGLPIYPHKLTPSIEDSFWVNLIGKGYPTPRHKFRWCTERLKIKPSNRFITEMVDTNGEAILFLGTRKAESTSRAATMTKHEKGRVRDRLSPNAGLPGTLVYTPIEDWTNDDVWMFLVQVKNPWGFSNKELLGMYAGATEDGECPLVVDTSTPSCGDSRFGCWVCTLVEKDKSMTAMIQNDDEKEWMLPLLELRNLIDFRHDGERKNKVTGKKEPCHDKRDAFNGVLGNELKSILELKSKKKMEDIVRDPMWERHIRDYRRLNTGKVQMMANGRYIPGPYIQLTREAWLKALLQAQGHMRENGPPEVAKLKLITLPELQEIRRIWVVDKHELEDTLPSIYEECTGEDYPGSRLDDQSVMGHEEMAILKELCSDDPLHYELVRDLIGIEQSQMHRVRRRGLFGDLEKSFQKHFYEDQDEAVAVATEYAEARAQAQEGIAPKSVTKAKS
jgi:DNA sulfur modification protein DndC